MKKSELRELIREQVRTLIKEASVSQEAYTIHNITKCGQDAAQNFIDDNKLDGKKLAAYVRQHSNSKEKYDVRDIIAGTGVGANVGFKSRFVKQFKESVIKEAKEYSFTFDYNTDDDDIEYINDLLKKARVNATAEAGTFDDEMVVKALNAIELNKAKKAIKADGFEINEAVINENEHLDLSKWKIGDNVEFSNGEIWKVAKPGYKKANDSIFLAPFNAIAKKGHISLAIEFTADELTNTVTESVLKEADMTRFYDGFIVLDGKTKKTYKFKYIKGRKNTDVENEAFAKIMKATGSPRSNFGVHGFVKKGQFDTDKTPVFTESVLKEDAGMVIDVAMGVAVGLMGLWALVQSAPLVGRVFGDAAEYLANKSEKKAKLALKNQRKETIAPIIAKFKNDKQLADMYQNLTPYSAAAKLGSSQAGLKAQQGRVNQLTKIGKYIKSKLTPEELVYFKDISAMLRDGDLK